MEAGSPPKSPGEGGYHDGGESSDTRGITIKEISATLGVRVDEGSEGRWIVFVGAPLVGCFIIGYTILELGRKKYLDKKDRDHITMIKEKNNADCLNII